jgi:hypothetical protein
MSVSSRLCLRDLCFGLCRGLCCIGGEWVGAKIIGIRIGHYGAAGDPAGEGDPLGVLPNEDSADEGTQHESQSPDNGSQLAAVRSVFVVHK